MCSIKVEKASGFFLALSLSCLPEVLFLQLLDAPSFLFGLLHPLPNSSHAFYTLKIYLLPIFPFPSFPPSSFPPPLLHASSPHSSLLSFLPPAHQNSFCFARPLLVEKFSARLIQKKNLEGEEVNFQFTRLFLPTFVLSPLSLLNICYRERILIGHMYGISEVE